MTNLGEMLRLYSMMRRLTVRQLAPEIGVSIATLSRIERGHAMDADTLMKVIHWALKEPPRSLTTGAGDRG